MFYSADIYSCSGVHMQFIFTHDTTASLALLQQGVVDVAFITDFELVDVPESYYLMSGVNISNFRILGPKASVDCQ